MQMNFSDFKQNLLEASGVERCKTIMNKARNISIGPYRSYDLKLFQIQPSEDVTNENNRIILDSFANLAIDNSSWKSIWQPIIKGREPIGLEVFSDGVNTSFHILLPPDHTDFMIRKMYGVFSGSKITPLDFREDYMLRFNSQHISDIYHLELRDHPVMPYRMDMSPIGNSVVEALEVLEPGELACIQILLQPLIADWQSKYKWAYYNYKQTNKLPPFGANPARYVLWFLEGVLNWLGKWLKGGKKADYNEEEYLHRIQGLNFESELDKAVRQKLQSNGFRTSIKVTVQSPNPEKRGMVSRTLSSSITNLGRYNTFMMKKYSKTQSDKALEEFKSRTITKDTFVSCSHEAANLVSLADAEAKAVKLTKAFPKEEPVSHIVSEGTIELGHTLEYQGKTLPVRAASKSFNEVHRTTVWLAPPGYGKTTVAKNLAIQKKRIGAGFFAADIADGDLATGILKATAQGDINTTAYFDFTDPNNIPMLSLSMIQGSTEMRASLFVEWFEQILNLSNNAPRAKVYLKKYALSCLSVDGFGLAEFKLMLEGNAKIINKVKETLRVKNPALFYWWTHKYEKDAEKILSEVEVIRYRLEDMFETDILRRAFATSDTPTDLKKMVDNGFGIVVNLSAGKVSKHVQQVIMSFFFMALWSIAKSREDVIQSGREPRSFCLLLDEPYTYIHKTDTIEEAVNKFRKYGFALNIFMHGADQIIKNSKPLWEEIMSSDPNLILGFVSDKTKKAVRTQFAMEDDDFEDMFRKVQNRDDHNFIIKMTFDRGSVTPFVFHSNPKPQELLHDDFLKNFKKKYAPLPKEEVDKAFFAKLFDMTPDQYVNSVKEADKEGEAEWADNGEDEVNEMQSGI